jgi:hypothetical protein
MQFQAFENNYTDIIAQHINRFTVKRMLAN